MRKRALFKIFIFLVAVLNPSILYSTGAIYTGMPYVTDESYEYWGMGRMAGVMGFVDLANHVLFGGQFGMYIWNNTDYSPLLVIEAYPSIRVNGIIPNIERTDIFIQAGFGATFINQGSRSTYYPSAPTICCINCSSMNTKEQDGIVHLDKLWAFGYNVGIGFTIIELNRVNFEIMPMYHHGNAGGQKNDFI